MRNNPFQGTGVAVVTPFTASGEVDFFALRELIERLIGEGGIDYLCALGTTAETPTLSEHERGAIVETFVDVVDSRVPLLLGCGGNNTGAVCAFLENSDFDGIDGVLIVTPYYNKPSQEGLYQHYKAVSSFSPVPVVLYNVPGRTGVNMTAETTLRLARDFENIVAIKEASGKIEQVEAILADAPMGFDVISGDDSLTFELVSLGASGVISVVANAYPSEICAMVNALRRDDMTEALHIHRHFRDIFHLAFVEGNPAGVKCMLAAREEIQEVLRLPLLPVSASTKNKIQEAISVFSL